jgi:hypothetical protein
LIDYRRRVDGGDIFFRIFGLPICVLALTTGISLVSVPAGTQASPVEARKPPGIQTLYYSPNVMERVFRCHMTPGCGDDGDYVPSLRRRADTDCLTAVNFNSRAWVRHNVVLVIDFWDPVQRRYERHRCQASDWQQRGHSTGSRQRFEIDWKTAKSVNAVPSNTTAKLVRVEE